ncbi:trypsin-like serine protease [Clostridium tarantellae]|uniref:Peptidase S1 domain-containing protein n=1 Tax=Clostridium tarantellae TaxID=39493 RepID=A0A6I1MLS1_9CLOT|nr:trypsin-like serine protease [Clostridium tarantellae]MPQ43683.1 hypothetical protein [Clostridium tarantellae]
MINKKNHIILCICKNNYKNFLCFKNVLGLGLGMKYTNSKNTNHLCIQVLVQKKESLCKLKYNDIIPKSYMNIATDIVEIGNAEAYALSSKIRPVQCGYSISPVNRFYSGTCGCIVERGSQQNMEYFLLSNNHVLADSNRIALGTQIVQPSRMDGGRITDVIANLTNFIPINYGFQGNLVDCAIARIRDNSIISNKIAWAGYPTGINNAIIGEQVEKIGRTTGRTSGLVRTIGTTLIITVGGRPALFQNQITLERMSQPGDSGSVVLNKNNEAVGLLMGGSPSISIANDFRTVLNSLRVNLTY